MKRIIFVLAVMLSQPTAEYAQNARKYCDLVVYRPGLKNYVAELRVDSNSMPKQALLRNPQGGKMKFSSEVDALNYVVNQGWDIVSAYNVRNNGTHFILIRK